MSLGGGGAPLQPDLVAKIDAEVATARPNTGYGMTETCGIITAVAGRLLRRQAGQRRPGHADLRGQVRRRRRPRGRAGRDRRAVGTRRAGDQGLHQPPRGHRRIRSPTAGCTPATSPASTRTASSSSSTARRTWSCAAARTSIAPRSRPHAPPPGGGRVLRVRRAGRAAGRGSGRRRGAARGPASRRRGRCAPTAPADLARHKIPRYIWFLTDSIPRNANGKFLKRELRERLKVEEAA